MISYVFAASLHMQNLFGIYGDKKEKLFLLKNLHIDKEFC